MTQQVKNLPAIPETQKTQVRSLGREDSPGAGNGSLLQYARWENPRDSGNHAGKIPQATVQGSQRAGCG